MFYGDYTFKEANTGYGPMVLNALNHYRKEAISRGFHLPEKLAGNFSGIARYAMDVSDPSGLLYPYGDTYDPRSQWTRGNTRAHNTVEINGQRQRDRGAAGGGMIVNDQFDLFDGYTDATEGFRHRRRILLVKPSVFWIVSDRMEARAAPEAIHRYTQAWHPETGIHQCSF